MIENRLCKNCKNRKTMNCPNSSECYCTKNKPYFVPINDEEKDKERERLNNIINELEKWAEGYIFADIFKDKIKELKGDGSNEI